MKSDPIHGSGRRTLGTLQPSAGDQAVLVGSGGKLRVDLKKVDTKRRRLNFDLENKPPMEGHSDGKPSSPHCSPALQQRAHQQSKHGDLAVYVDVSHSAGTTGSTTPRRNHTKAHARPGSAIVSREAYDLLLRDDASVDYWKMIAEERRVALERTLEENRQLHEDVEVLVAENKHLQKVADHCAELAELVKALTAGENEDDDDDDDDNQEPDANNNRNGTAVYGSS